MIDITLEEAQLFRLLAGFFGKERVVPQMSVLTVCGGELPEEVLSLIEGPSGRDGGLVGWARSNKCLFTIVDDDDQPKMVVEFFSGFTGSIDAREAEHQQFLKPILGAVGIPYLTISNDEFLEILDPEGTLDFFSFLQSKIVDLGLMSEAS